LSRAGRPAETGSLVSEERRDALNREEKKQAIEELRDKFQRAKGMVLTDYKGLTVAEMTEFRNVLRSSDVEYRVVKNTLARIATEDTPAAALGEHFKGPVGVAMSYDDPATAPKAVLEFAKKNEKLSVTSGVVDGTLCDAGQIKTIADLPPREVLLGILAGTMQAPAAKMARLLNATICKVAYALNALKDKKAAA
jgi:large subunit ribosomal protein L10